MRLPFVLSEVEALGGELPFDFAQGEREADMGR